MRKKNFIYLLTALTIVFLILIPLTTSLAQGFVPKPADDSACGGTDCNSGDYTLNEIVSILPLVAKWILGIVGSLALLAFIYGGILFLISSGSNEKVAKAKQVIIGAVIGLAIVFTSYIIIGFVFKALGVNTTEWYNTNWFK